MSHALPLRARGALVAVALLLALGAASPAQAGPDVLKRSLGNIIFGFDSKSSFGSPIMIDTPHGSRHSATAIYFLLSKGERSHWPTNQSGPIRDALVTASYEPGVISAKQYGEMIDRELKQWGAIVRETIDFITKRFPHLTREEAYMIASVAVDYHVTQVVDGTKGIHGMIPKSIFVAQR